MTQTMKSPNLYRDERGAVMITGLFMSLFLIGSLWFVMGIGDAVVFRDKMQEASDHGAFASVALHAKGMNFITVCNLVMLVGTVIHIILGIISDVKFAQAVACVAKTKIILSFLCIPKIISWWKAYDRWDDYFDKMKPAFEAIHTAQKVASYAYPALGVANALQIGGTYGNDTRTGPVRVIALSTSIIPGGGINGSSRPQSTGSFTGNMPGRSPKSWWGADLGNFSVSSTSTPPAQNNGSGKEGLPVQAKEFSDLCMKAVSVTGNGLAMAFGGTGQSGRVMKILNKLIGMGLKLRYCNSIHLHFPPLGPGFDRFWGKDGPYVVYGPAQNGNMWFQTWALNVNATLKDNNETRVGIAMAKGRLIPTKAELQNKGFYFAQAEFYFDCEEEWKAMSCNGDDHATYAIKWRARLRRLDISNLLGGAVGGALEALTNMSSYGQFKDGIIDRVVGQIGGAAIGGFITQGILGDFVKDLAGQAEGWVKDQIGGALPSGPVIPGVYH